MKPPGPPEPTQKSSQIPSNIQDDPSVVQPDPSRPDGELADGESYQQEFLLA